MAKKKWLFFALITTFFWGVWGALIEIPEKSGFPATLGYVVWAITMIPCALIALMLSGWKLETGGRSILLGSIVGFTGAGGQLLLFEALREGPAYIVFPLVSLFPILTVLLSMMFLREKAQGKHRWGIVIALIAIFFLSWQPAAGGNSQTKLWLLLAVLVFVLWGLQAFVMKWAGNSMSAESIFFYMMITGLLLIPIAICMTDFSKPVNLGFRGPWLASMIHVLNAIGALTLVYALRYGKAIVVVPLTGLSPVITIVLSLLLYRVMPGTVLTAGLVLAVAAIYLLCD